MLYDVADRPGAMSAADLRAAYEAELADVVEGVGVPAVAEGSGVDRETLEALVAGESPELTLEQAAAVLACAEGSPDADAVVMEVRDHLLMGMTTAVLDVDTVASHLDIDRSGQEVQQMLEGRVPMTLADLAAIHGVIASRNDR